jgi:hypothetical protein
VTTLSAALLALSATTAPAQASVKWAHPKVHAWATQNANDFVNAIGGIFITINEMRCDPNAHDCETGTLTPDLSSNEISVGCPELSAANATVRSDGPMPGTKVQRWWSTALDQSVKGCAALTKYLHDPNPPDPTSTQDAAAAVADFTAVNDLLARVNKYVGQVCIPGYPFDCSTTRAP